MSRHKTLLAITGPGRCGTSVLAKFCRKMGYDPGGNWNDNVDAGLESQQIIEIHNNIIDGNPEAAERGIQNVDRRVIKDPRLFLYNGCFETWIRIRPGVRFLVLLRNPADVVDSLERHPEHFQQDRPIIQQKRGSVDRLRATCLTRILTLLDIEAKFKLLSFPSFLKRYDTIHHLLTDFGGLQFDYEEGKEAWTNLVNVEKAHPSNND